MSGVVKNISRYSRRVSAVDSIAYTLRRFVIVGTVSSAARIPFPSATIARAVLARSVAVSISAMTHPLLPLSPHWHSLSDIDSDHHCGSMLFQDVALNRLCKPFLGIRFGHSTRATLYVFARLPHRDAQPTQSEHEHIVGHVPHGRDGLGHN